MSEKNLTLKELEKSEDQAHTELIEAFDKWGTALDILCETEEYSKTFKTCRLKSVYEHLGKLLKVYLND